MRRITEGTISEIEELRESIALLGRPRLQHTPASVRATRAGPHATASRFTTVNPATGEVLATVRIAGAAAIESAVRAARSIDPARVTDLRLRTVAVGEAASLVAAFPEVRLAILQFQRDFAAPAAAITGHQ